MTENILCKRLSQYITEKNLHSVFTVAEPGTKGEAIIYVHKRDALSKFYRKNLELRFKDELSFITFKWMGQIKLCQKKK